MNSIPVRGVSVGGSSIEASIIRKGTFTRKDCVDVVWRGRGVGWILQRVTRQTHQDVTYLFIVVLIFKHIQEYLIARTLCERHHNAGNLLTAYKCIVSCTVYNSLPTSVL